MVTPTQVVLVDDHKLFRNGLQQLIESSTDQYAVKHQFNHGQEFIDFLEKENETKHPDIAIMDLSMPKLNGLDTAQYLKEHFPHIKILILTMKTDQYSLINAVKVGVHGYIQKDIEEKELIDALDSVHQKSYYFTEKATRQLVNAIKDPYSEKNNLNMLNERELNFIKLSCSEDTYEQIADKMCLSPKTIDGYRASVFEKLNLKSRVGMVIYAFKTGIYQPDYQP